MNSPKGRKQMFSEGGVKMAIFHPGNITFATT
jgi:hypothetical protein